MNFHIRSYTFILLSKTGYWRKGKAIYERENQIHKFTFSADIHKLLEHIGVDSEPACITPSRGPPLWDECGAQEQGEGVDTEPDWDIANQTPPDYPEDQRTTW